jgi:hypothetical protein
VSDILRGEDHLAHLGLSEIFLSPLVPPIPLTVPRKPLRLHWGKRSERPLAVIRTESSLLRFLLDAPSVPSIFTSTRRNDDRWAVP